MAGINALKIRQLHPWNVSPKEAVKIQKELAAQVILKPFNESIRFIAGADVSYDRKSNTLFAAVLVFEFPPLHVCETQTVLSTPQFPYVPGLLSFRELPPLLECFQKLSVVPDVVLCDGQGYAHPRRFGLACHLGLLLDLPAVGCAKSRLVGVGEGPDSTRGSSSVLYDRGEEIGFIVRTKNGIKPLYISPGHLITGNDAVRIVIDCCTGYRLPEPTRQAHLEVNLLREKFLQSK